MCWINELHLPILCREAYHLQVPPCPVEYLLGPSSLMSIYVRNQILASKFLYLWYYGGILGSWVLYDMDMKKTCHLWNNANIQQEKGWTTVHQYHRTPLSNNSERPLIHATTWMNLKNTTLSERRHTQKNTYFIIPFVQSKTGKSNL